MLLSFSNRFAFRWWVIAGRSIYCYFVDWVFCSVEQMGLSSPALGDRTLPTYGNGFC